MDYTVKRLADLAGVSSRTLRYYDKIGLLKPSKVNLSGYRIYGEKEVDLLQQILFYKSMDMKLDEIKHIISNENFDRIKSLKEHHQKLITKRNRLNQLILTVEKTISYNKGEMKMSDKEKFEGFKKEKLAENEAKYGKEIREKYNKETVEESNEKFMNMSENDLNKMNEIEREMFEALLKVAKTKDLESDSARDVYDKHKAWLSFTWPSYSAISHIGLAKMYVEDEKFAKYYNDRAGVEIVNIMRDIIVKYAK